MAIYVAKTKALISCAVILGFVFAYAKNNNNKKKRLSHEAAHLIMNDQCITYLEIFHCIECVYTVNVF